MDDNFRSTLNKQVIEDDVQFNWLIASANVEDVVEQRSQPLPSEVSHLLALYLKCTKRKVINVHKRRKH